MRQVLFAATGRTDMAPHGPMCHTHDRVVDIPATYLASNFIFHLDSQLSLSTQKNSAFKPLPCDRTSVVQV